MLKIVATLLWDLISGEVWRIYAAHKAAVKAQAVADAPTTREELEKTLEDGKL